MADLYGMPGLEDEALNMPGLVPHVSRVGQYYNQLQQQVQQAQQERQARELPPLPAPQEAPPAAPISYVDWPTYQQMRQGADPAQVYTEYTQGVLVNQLRSMGATPEQIQQGQELFKQLVPPPALARPTTWGGRFGELGTAVGQEMGAVKRSLLGAQAFVGGNKEEAARLLAEQQQAEEQVPTSQKAFRAGLRPDWYTPSGAAAFVRSAISEPQGFFDSTAQFVANMLGTWVAPEMVGAAAGTAAGPVGTVVGGPLAVGAAQGAMKAGEIGLQKLAQQAVAAGIDPKNSQQVAAWLQAGGADNLFGPLTDVTKGGLTNAAVLTLTLGLAKYAGSVSSKLLGESGMVGQAEATAAAAGVPATRAESATANKLLTQARLAKAGEAAVGAGGFAGAAALSNLAADLPVDEQELFSNAAMFLIPYSFGLKRFVRPGAPEAGKPVTPAKPAEGAPPGEAPKGGGALTEEEINEAAAAALPEKGAVAAPAAAKPEVKPPPAKAEDIEGIKSFAKDTTPEERAQAVTDALDTAREDPEQQQQIIEALVALHLTRDVKEESANEIVQQVAQAAHENQVKPKRARKPKPAVEPATAESPLATRAAAAAESPIDAAVAAEVGRGAPAAERTVEPTGNGPLLQGVGGEAEAGPNRAAGVGVNEEGVHPRTPLESGGGKPARGARRNRAATVAEPSVPVGGEGGGEPSRAGADKVLNPKELLDSSKYIYHAVRNDEDIPTIMREGLRPGTNVSVDTKGQAFNEGETILVFRKGDYKTQGKGYQEDHVVQSGRGKPVAILKDTEPFERAQRTPEAVEKGWAALEQREQANDKLADGLWRGAGLEAEAGKTPAQSLYAAFDRIASQRGLRAQDERQRLQRELRQKLGDFYDRASEVATEHRRVDQAMERFDTEEHPGTTHEDVLAKYAGHGVPVYRLHLDYDEKTDRTKVKVDVRSVANPLLAGKEATEAANRKTEADIAEALRREAEGPVNEARGPTNEHVSSTDYRRIYELRRKWISETLAAAEERLRRNPTNVDAQEAVTETRQRLATLDAKFLPAIERVEKMERGEFIPIIQEHVAAGNIKRVEQPLYEALAHGATRSALDWIAKNSTNPLHKLVAKFLLHANITPEARFEVIPSGAKGDYMAATDRIRMNPQEYLDNISTSRMVQTLLHEVVHGGTVNALSKAHELLQRIEHQWPLSDADRQYMQTHEFKAAKNLFDAFDWMRKNDPQFEQRFHYGAKDPFEMVTEALTNPAFQQYLKTIKLPWDIAGIKLRTAWDWFVDKIKTVLGLPGVSNDALSHIMEMSFAVARERNPVQMEKGRTYAPQYNRLIATPEEVRGQLGILGKAARAREKATPPATEPIPIERLETHAAVDTALEKEDYRGAADALAKGGLIDWPTREFLRAIADGATRSVLEHIQQRSSSMAYRVVAKFLRRLNTLPKIEIDKEARKDGAYYSPEDDTVGLSPTLFQHDPKAMRGNFEYAILHELVHGATMHAIIKASYYLKHGPEQYLKYGTPEEKAYLNSTEFKAAQHLMEVFDWLKANHGKVDFDTQAKPFRDAGIALDVVWGSYDRPSKYSLRKWGTEEHVDPASLPPDLKAAFDRLATQSTGKFEKSTHYGASDPLEMVAEALSNRYFQSYLQDIKLPPELTKTKFQTAWDWFVSTLKKMLRMEDAPHSALSHIIDTTTALARERQPPKMAPGEPRSSLTNKVLLTDEEAWGHSYFREKYPHPFANEQAAPGIRPVNLEVEKKTADARKEELAKSYEQKGPGHIIGIKDGATTHRAWENEDGTYRFYKVTPEEPNGAKDSHVDIPEDEVYSRIEAAGAIPENRTLGDYGIAGNNRNQIARWKDGRLVATAIKGDDGTWHYQTSENLAREFRSIYTPQKQDFPTRAEAERAADAVSKHKSFQESEDARIIDQERALSGGEWKVTPGLSSKFRNFLWNKESPMYMLGRAIQAYYERAGRNMPQGMDVLAAWFLRHSYAGRDMERGREQATPLIQKARQIIQDSPYLKHSKDGYDRLNKALSALIINERLPKLLPRYTDEAKWIDGEEAKGETPEYKQAQKNLEEAEAHLKFLDTEAPGLKDKLYAMMREWKKYSDETVDIERKFGLKSDLQAKKIKSAYSIYGPIKTEGKVSPGKTATGQTWLGNDILSRIVEQRMDAIARGYDNLATNTMLKWAKVGDILNPDGTKVFKVEPVDREHLQHDPDTGEITVTQRLNENKSIIFWQDGRPMRMELQGKFGEQLLGAMKHLQEAEHTHAIKTALGYAGFYTRMFSALHTSLSPAFALRNFVRDIATNVSQLDKRISYGKLGKAMADPAVWGAAAKLGYKQAAKTFGKDTVGHYSEQDLAQALAAAKKGQANTEQMGWLVDHYQPLIEHRLRYGNEQITSDWPTALRPSVKSGIKEYLAPADGRLTNFISGSTHMLEGVNRIAVFKAGLEAGLTPEQAALAAKNSTTNFELRGSMAPTVNPLYAFANAKMQGMRTLAENLGFSPTHGLGTGGFKQAARGLVGGKIAESANVRTVRAAQLAIALGLGAGYANYTNSEKDKDGRTSYGKRSEYQLDEYLHIPGTNLDLPIPQEIGSFYNIGSSMADQLWGDRAGSASTPMVRFITAMLQNFWPLGTSMHDPIGVHGEGGDYVARLAMPTQVVPVYDVVRNMTTFGAPVNRQRESTTIPPELQGAAHASPLAQGMAKGLHEYGVMDTSPAAIDHVLLSLFQQQRGFRNAITDNSLGALLDETVKSFHQKEFPGTTKNDYDTVSTELKMQAAREKGGALKTKQYTGLARDFANTDNKLKTLAQKWNKAKTAEEKDRIDKQEDELRMNVLKKYYEATGVVHP